MFVHSCEPEKTTLLLHHRAKSARVWNEMIDDQYLRDPHHRTALYNGHGNVVIILHTHISHQQCIYNLRINMQKGLVLYAQNFNSSFLCDQAVNSFLWPLKLQIFEYLKLSYCMYIWYNNRWEVEETSRVQFHVKSEIMIAL